MSDNPNVTLNPHPDVVRQTTTAEPFPSAERHFEMILPIPNNEIIKFKPAMRRKEIRKELRKKAREVCFQDKLLAEWMNQLADKI